MAISADYCGDCCSFETILKGVMFYPGVKQLNPAVLSWVKFIRDENNSFHKKAVFVKLVDSGEILGHLTRQVAEASSMILDFKSRNVKTWEMCTPYVTTSVKPHLDYELHPL